MQSAVRESARLQVQLARLMTRAASHQLKVTTLGHKLVPGIPPIRERSGFRSGREHYFWPDINRCHRTLISNECLAQRDKLRRDALSQIWIPCVSRRIVFPFFQLSEKVFYLHSRTLH